MWWTIAKEAAINWSRHKDARQGAALAYYSVCSLGPIIVIAIAIAGFVFGHDAVTSQVTGSLKDLLGDTGAKAIEAMLAGASRPAEGALTSGSVKGATPAAPQLNSCRLLFLGIVRILSPGLLRQPTIVSKRPPQFAVSFITEYSNATPSRSCSANHALAASSLANTLR